MRSFTDTADVITAHRLFTARPSPAQNSGFFILYDKLINDAVKNTAKNPADI